MAINRIKTGGITDNTIQSGDLAPGTIASDRIAPGTIANDRLANNTITINGTSIALGASGDIVAGTDWQAVTVADGSTTLNTVAGAGYLLDTNAGVIEAFLPTSPTRGDTVILVDYSGTFATNRVIVNTGGINIDSTATGDVQLTTNNTIAEFIYIDSSKGWLVKTNQAAGTTPSSAINEYGGYDTPGPFIEATGGTVTTSGDYKIHTFTGDGCFAVTNEGNPEGSTTVDYLVIAGGAGSGNNPGSYSGGGGAGGYRESSGTASGCYTASPLGACVAALPVSATTYPVTVGAGGSGNSNGSNSIFSTITSAGGGKGAVISVPAPEKPAFAGGSGGGGNFCTPSGGAGNTPPTSPPQGNNGGTGETSPPAFGSGGGGGASAVGQNGNTSKGGNGGAGIATCITGTPVLRAGGGGGYAVNVGTQGGTGGPGGGGDGYGPSGPPGTGPASQGAVNTGGGAGGAAPDTTNNGGSGIVVIRYKFQ